MKELVDLIVKKTGIPVATAQTIVTIVVDFLGKKLPAPIAAQMKLVLNNDAAMAKVENVAEGLLGKISSGKKK